MGIFVAGQPLDWPSTLAHAELFQEIAVQQFIRLYQRTKSLTFPAFKFGDEVSHWHESFGPERSGSWLLHRMALQTTTGRVHADPDGRVGEERRC